MDPGSNRSIFTPIFPTIGMIFLRVATICIFDFSMVMDFHYCPG